MIEDITPKHSNFREVRTEDKHYVYLAKFDSYFKDTVISLSIINKATAQYRPATPDDYFRFGVIIGREEPK